MIEVYGSMPGISVRTLGHGWGLPVCDCLPARADVELPNQAPRAAESSKDCGKTACVPT